MTQQTKTIVAWAALAAIGATATTAGEANLKARYITGDEHFYIRTINTTQTTTVDGAPAGPELHISTEVGMRLRVLKGNADGSAVLECTLLYIDRAEVDGDRLATYDSRHLRSTGSPRWIVRLLELVDHPITLHLDTSGRVVKIEAWSPDVNRDHLRFENLLSDSALRQLPLFATAGAGMQAKPASTWKRSFTIDIPMSANTLLMEEVFTVDSVEVSSANVSWTTSYRGQDSATPSSRPGALMRVEVMDGSGSGRLTWDQALGVMERSQVESRIRLAHFAPGATNSQAVETDRTSSEDIKRVPLSAFKMPAKPNFKAGKTTIEKDAESAKSGDGSAKESKPATADNSQVDPTPRQGGGSR